MNRFFSVFLFFISSLCLAKEDETKKNELKEFMYRADVCIHLSGELSGGNEKNQEDIILDVNKECGLAKKSFVFIENKYENDVEVKTILDKYRDDLFN
jgi:hypothetical protein